MSTTIEVIPIQTKDISFGEVMAGAEKFTQDYFDRFRISKHIAFVTEIINCDDSNIRRFPAKDDIFGWNEDEYALIYFPGEEGNADVSISATYDETDPKDSWWYFDLLRNAPRYSREMEDLIDKAKKLNHSWSFRRSMGQPAIIHICYGLIAASVAKLSGGLMFSDDGAWDWQRFPATADEFLEWYFSPNLALGDDNAVMARRCIEDVRQNETPG